MENVTSVSFGPLAENTSSLKPVRMYYCQNGTDKNWDLIKVPKSVAIIIFNKTSNKLVFVKDFRPALYYPVIRDLGYKNGEKVDLEKYPLKLGIAIHLCEGPIDKELPLKEIVKEKVLVQCGFNVSTDNVEEVMTYKSGVGTTGSSQIMLYCEVEDKDKVTDAGSTEDKPFDVIEVSMQEAQDMVKQGANTPSPPNFVLGLLWFLRNKKVITDI